VPAPLTLSRSRGFGGDKPALRVGASICAPDFQLLVCVASMDISDLPARRWRFLIERDAAFK